MATPAEPAGERPGDEKGIEATRAEVRNPLANRAAVLAARERSMSERLELALSWNAVAAELRAGLAEAKRLESGHPRHLTPPTATGG